MMNETIEETVVTDTTAERITNNEAIMHSESLQIQKAEWMKQETARRRKQEDDMLEQLMVEQRMLDSMNHSIDANIKLTQESRRYCEEVKEGLHDRVYAIHGISPDKLFGMKEYKNAYYKGTVFTMFLMSAILVVLCGIFHGITTQITLFMAFFTGIEGALLTRERDRGRILDGLCKLLYLLLFPAMLIIFVCYEMDLPQYAMLLPYFSIVGGIVLILGTVSFFVYSPYREDRKKAGEARNTLRELERRAEKEVKKNQRQRVKEEKKEEKAAAKERERHSREAEKAEDIRIRQEQKAARRTQNAILRLEKKEAFKETAGEKWENFKSRFHKKEVEIIEASIVDGDFRETECPDKTEEPLVAECADNVEKAENTN